MRMQPVFDSWDCTPPILPPRSRLYSLEPIGIGTPFVESLSGYLTRLADAHAVSVSNLVARGLSPLLSNSLVQPLESHCFQARFYAMNGLGEPAKRWVQALQIGTMRTDLRLLTLLPFEGLLWEHAIFRRCRAWCAACYEDDRAVGKPVHERLLWALKTATFCPRHRRPLQELCPHCSRRVKPLTAYSRPGYCSTCQEWLGRTLPPGQSTVDEHPADAGLWYSDQLGALISAASALESTSLRNTLAENFRACLDCIAEGHKCAFAEAAGVFRQTVNRILAGDCQPSIPTLLRISYNLKVPLTSFLERELARAIASWQEAKGRIRKARLPSARSADHIRAELERAASEQPPPRLIDVARRLNYVKPDRLYRVDPSLCKQINANYQSSLPGPRSQNPSAKQFCSSEQVRSALEASLAQELPTSPYHVALKLGFVTGSSLVRKFPSLCRAIQEKIDNHKASRIAAMGSALTAALTEDPPPGLGELCERLGYCRPIVLRRQFNSLCDELLERRRKYRLDQIEQLRQQLLGLSLESPAVSLEEACRRVGYSRQQLIRLCPEEAAAIVAHYDRACREDAQQRVEELHRQVRQIVRRLHEEGKFPSAKRVISLLGKSTSQDWWERTAAIRAARAELNDGSSGSGEVGLKDSQAESR